VLDETVLEEPPPASAGPGTVAQARTKLLLVDQAVAFGGSIVVLAHLLKFLDRQRYDCVLVTAMPQDVLDTLFDPGIRTVRLKPRHDYRRRNELKEKFRWLGRHGTRLASYWFTILSFAGNVQYRWRLRQLLRIERPQLVHINNNCFFSAEICALLGQRYVFHYHGLTDAPLPAWNRWVLSKAALFISISEYISNIARRHRAAHFQPIRTIPNPAPAPVDLPSEQLIALKHAWKIDPAATVVGIFGRLVGWKGQREFLQAFKGARAAFPNTVALVVGDASDLGQQYEAQLRQWVLDQNLQDAVVFTGYSSNVGPLYQICDIVVHASIEPEPFGLVIVEAMSAGAAVVASPLGAGPEIIHHGVTGLIADPRSTPELTAALLSLLEDPEQRKRIALAGKVHAREKYAPQRFAQAIDAAYQEALARSD
jgi:glycosyltransferase involved in cell wall biosynthesis